MTLLVLVLYISYVLMLFLSYQSSFRPALLRSDERLLLYFILFSFDSQGNEHIFKKELHKMNHHNIPTTILVRYTESSIPFTLRHYLTLDNEVISILEEINNDREESKYTRSFK